MPSNGVHLVTGSYDSTIRFWDASGGHTTRTIKFDEKSPVNTIAISSDGRYLAAGGIRTLKVYDAETIKANEIFSREDHKAGICTVGFNKETKWIYTGSEDTTIKIWDIRTTGYIRNFSNSFCVNDVSLNPDQSELISVDEEGYIRVWDLLTSTCRLQLCPSFHTPIHCCAISPNGKHFVACNKKGNIYKWSYNDQHELIPEKVIDGHNKYILNCKFSPNSKLLCTTSADQSVKIWDSDTLENTSILYGHEKYVWDCSFSSDSKMLVTASSDQTARLWDLSSAKTLRHYLGHEKAVSCVALYEARR
ncbi:hypothetical protein WA158_005374 [Blastocystis sp. Blastoise]